MILDGVSLALPSRYEGLLSLLTGQDEQFQSKLKTLGFWNCNITNQKFIEIFSLLSEQLKSLPKFSFQALEISDNVNILKKLAIGAIGDLLLTIEKKPKKLSLLLQRCSISPKNVALLMKLLAISKIRDLSLIDI